MIGIIKLKYISNNLPYKIKIYIEEIPNTFRINVVNSKKNNLPYDNYINCGFFYLKDDCISPIGNLKDCGNIISQSCDCDELNIHNKKLSTLCLNSDGIIYYDKISELSNTKILSAISGIPIIINDHKVTIADIKNEGYSGNNLHYTWHGFLGINDSNNLTYVGCKCSFKHMANILRSVGLKTALMIDGGGSYIFKQGDFKISSIRNRIINNVLIW